MSLNRRLSWMGLKSWQAGHRTWRRDQRDKRPGRPGWLPTQVSGKEVTSPPPNADDEFGWLVLGVVVW